MHPALQTLRYYATRAQITKLTTQEKFIINHALDDLDKASDAVRCLVDLCRALLDADRS